MSTVRMLICAALAATAAAAHADVTVTTTTEGKASFINVGGEGTAQFKGKRQRSDSNILGKAQSLIIDVDNLRFIDLDAKKKTATVTPLASIGDELAKAGIGTMQATLTKTSQTKSVAGYPCTVHDVRIAMPFSPTGNAGDGMDLTMVLAGTACLGTTVPGLADYQTFYQAAADSGFIFGDPRTAKSPAGAAQAKAYAALTKKMAEAGMALETHVTISASGSGPMAGLMSKAIASDIRTTVTKITAGDLPADTFDIPAGFKVKTQK